MPEPPNEPDRYEPLPGIAELPAWLWRKAGRGVRIAVGVALIAAVATAIAVAPTIRESGQSRAAADRRERGERRAQLIRELKAEQRPRRGRSDSLAPAGAAPPQQLAARAAVMDELTAAIQGDARRRVREGQLDGAIRRVECEPFPRGVDPAVTRRSGRYACLAVTSEFEGGAIGQPYRAKIDFESGRYAFCKISGQAGPSREQLATTPHACGG
jgi:hypothetical protein